MVRSLPLLESHPELVIAQRPAALRAPVRERRRTGQGARFLYEYLEVMLRSSTFCCRPKQRS